MARPLTRLLALGLLPLAAACASQSPPPGPSPEEVLRANMDKLAEADRAVNAECFGKLERREIATNRSYVECYIAKVRPAYQQYGPENLDLLDSLGKQWRAIADQLDAGKLKSADAQSEMARVKADIEATARQRAADAEAQATASAADEKRKSNVEGSSAEATQNRRFLENGLHDKSKPNPAGGAGGRTGS